MSEELRNLIVETQDAFRADPAEAQATFESVSSLGEGFRSEVALRDHRLVVDEPESLGGTDTGPNPVELILAVSAFCVGGVLEKFPKLRVAFLEGNCSWLPWLMYRMDEYCELQGAMAEIPLRKKPSEYFREQCFISADVDEALVVNVIDYMGDDNIVFSTDYPHIDSRWPEAVSTFTSIPGLKKESLEKILWTNCARLYGLD